LTDESCPVPGCNVPLSCHWSENGRWTPHDPSGTGSRRPGGGDSTAEASAIDPGSISAPGPSAAGSEPSPRGANRRGAKPRERMVVGEDFKAGNPGAGLDREDEPTEERPLVAFVAGLRLKK
jgi:hypothetical protein